MIDKNYFCLQNVYVNFCNTSIKYNENLIHIGTLDNPGWHLKVQIKNLGVFNRDIFVDIERTKDDWLYCKVEKDEFRGFCGPLNLIEVLQIFHHGLERDSNANLGKNSHSILEWLMNWYLSNCDGDWEHEFGIKIYTDYNLGWKLEVSLQWTNCQNKQFIPKSIQRSDKNWYSCYVLENDFRASCGPLNLVEVLEIFKLWSRV
jgi:hypothetical protein